MTQASSSPEGCLDGRGRLGRWIAGLLGSGATLIVAIELVRAGAPWTRRLLVLPFAFFGAIGLLQASAGT